MKTSQIIEIHTRLLEIYQQNLLPVINNYFGNDGTQAHEKPSAGDPPTLVTEADLAINKILLKELPELVPGATVVSEESPETEVSNYTFVIDPIDGTVTFARNLDDWGISIVLCEKGMAVYSVIFFPKCHTEYYYAIKGLGAFDDGDRKIAAKKVFEFKPTLVSAPSSRKVGRGLINFTEGKGLAFRACGSAVYAAYTLLRGGTDFIAYDRLNIWDILGCAFIAEQAGYVVEWLEGNSNLTGSVDLKSEPCTLLLYKSDLDRKLLAEAKEVISKARGTK